MAKVTIADIAKETGLSATTISRYLNGKYEYMSEATRKRIAEAIGKSEYKPNKMARSLRLRQSQMIGVLVSDITSPFSAIVFKGITEYCEPAGYTVLLADAGDNPETERKYIQSMLAQGVDGLIINATGADVAYLNEVNRLHVPIVLADRPVEGFEGMLVTSNIEESMNTILQFIKDKGYESVCYVTGTIGTNGVRRYRTEAFRHYTQLIWGTPGVVIEYSASDKEVMASKVMAFATATMSDGTSKKRAILTGNGIVLNDVAKLLQQHQLEIGQDIGLGSYDNWPWMDVIGPGITVMEVPAYELGKRSAERLLQRIQRNDNDITHAVDNTRDVLPCRLIVRHSI